MLAADGPAAFDPALPADRSRAVAATVEASLALLSDQDRNRCLDLAIFPEDVDIAAEVLTLLWPGRRPEALCEDLVELGLVSDYRLDPPGARLVLHDLVRAYLRHQRRGPDRAAVHTRLIDAATDLLPPDSDAGTDGDPTCSPWCALPESAGYLWRYHHFGSIILALADLELAGSATATQLRHALAADATLLGPIEPPEALGATLASRLDSIPQLEALLRRYRLSLPRPRLEPARPLPDRPGALAALDCGLGHTGSVWTCAFSPDGTLLATTSDDHTIRLWNVADGTQEELLTGHTDWVRGCAFSPDGTLLASTGYDATARLWRVADRTQQAVLSDHDGPVGIASGTGTGQAGRYQQ
ncbi:MAG: hypothetical protein AUG49_18600 [Catenulispora sp. 13_1_20CM_3_70_7]|nr:MAG: hypothetical protein AUG49_18600 [Catenulispora sp. 13_1_20CM_3_70_7]